MNPTHTYNGKACTIKEKTKPWMYAGTTYWRKVVLVTYEDGSKETVPFAEFHKKAFIRHQEQPQASAILRQMLKGKINPS
jgi:hypothetical protein